MQRYDVTFWYQRERITVRNYCALPNALVKAAGHRGLVTDSLTGELLVDFRPWWTRMGYWLGHPRKACAVLGRRIARWWRERFTPDYPSPARRKRSPRAG